MRSNGAKELLVATVMDVHARTLAYYVEVVKQRRTNVLMGYTHIGVWQPRQPQTHELAAPAMCSSRITSSSTLHPVWALPPVGPSASPSATTSSRMWGTIPVDRTAPRATNRRASSRWIRASTLSTSSTIPSTTALPAMWSICRPAATRPM